MSPMCSTEHISTELIYCFAQHFSDSVFDPSVGEQLSMAHLTKEYQMFSKQCSKYFELFSARKPKGTNDSSALCCHVSNARLSSDVKVKLLYQRSQFVLVSHKFE